MREDPLYGLNDHLELASIKYMEIVLFESHEET